MGLKPALNPGDIVKIDNPGHRAHGHLGVVISGPGEFMGTYAVEVAGTGYGFVPSELTRIQAVPREAAPDMTAEEYNVVMDALMARAAAAPNYALKQLLLVADSLRQKFGRHAEHRS